VDGPTESAGLFCSTTIPTVLAKRIGEWGTLPGKRNISPVMSASAQDGGEGGE
jgi:hypothetical protein